MTAVLIFYGHSVQQGLCFDCVMFEHREINGGCSEEQRMKMVGTNFMALLEPALKGSYWKYGSFGTFLSWNTRPEVCLPEHFGYRSLCSPHPEVIVGLSRWAPLSVTRPCPGDEIPLSYGQVTLGKIGNQSLAPHCILAL